MKHKRKRKDFRNIKKILLIFTFFIKQKIKQKNKTKIKQK
jgi:hypothetical protein